MSETHVFYSTLFATFLSALPGLWAIARTYRITAKQAKMSEENQQAHGEALSAIADNTTVTKEIKTIAVDVEAHTNGLVQKLVDTTRAEGVSEGVAQEQSAQAVRNQIHR